MAQSSNSPRGMPLSLLRCSATLTGPSYFWGLSLRLRNWAPACAGAGGFSFCSFVSEFHFDPRCNFLSHAHPFQFILHFTNRRIREFPCCRANILEKGRGFPRKLFEDGAITSTRAASRLRQPSCFRGPILFQNVGNPEGARHSGRLSLLTFFGEAKKVSCRRATPGSVAKSSLHNPHAAQIASLTAPYDSRNAKEQTLLSAGIYK